MPDSPQLQDPPPPPAPPPPPPPPPASPTPAEPAAANAQLNLIPVKPRMIIKGVLGRYERWNPVHPTAGTFWGVGLGLGCGVGWGFGPEVIGYVGAGCGVGFSVGFTLAGVGIGLPQHVLIRNNEDSGFMPLDSARYYAVTAIRGLVGDAINYVTAMRKESRQKLLKFQENPPVSGGIGLGKGMPSSIQSTVECIRAFKDENWPS
ncbi:forkhead box protein D1-like isoform X1 [Panicum virgatum]|uniref:forkhead box protein D1-like isoform X1 n=1 Tax=Panicum virgatum TaxID=38727 RepID=UPI0019D568A0|nr:forkhead box protein D1-like isoform X1 [Panicum virgatum]